MKWSMSESMRVATAWLVWGFLSLGILGSGTYVLLDYAGLLKDAPAWVQAIGSIGAILAAILIAQRGVIQQRYDKQLESYEYMQKAFGVTAYATAVIEAAAQYVLDGVPTVRMLKYHVSLLELALEDLRGVDPIQLGDPAIAEAFLSLKRNANLTRSAIMVVIESGEAFNTDQVSKWGPYARSQTKAMSTGMVRYLSRHPRLLDEINARLVSEG